MGALLRAQLTGGRDLVIRGGAFQVCFLSMTAVASRFGAAALGAHQIAWELWLFCALVLDAIAIAAQSLVGAALGGSDAVAARSLARQFIRVGLVCGLVIGVLIGAGVRVLPATVLQRPARARAGARDLAVVRRDDAAVGRRVRARRRADRRR